MPKCRRLVMIEKRVVSCPPCCVALDVNAPPTLPCNTPRAQSPPAWSRKFAICDDRRPRPLRDSIRHRFDMAIGRVVENQDLRHDLILRVCAWPALRRVDHDEL